MKCETHIRKYEDYLIANSKSKETVESYVRTIKQFLKLCKNLDDINKDDLDRYKLYAVKKYNSNSLTPRYASINLYLKYIGKSKDWRDENRLKPPKQYTPNKIPLTEDEIKGLFRVSKHYPRDNAILKVFYYGLLRRSELQNLNLDDVDYQRNKLRINAGKGNKYDTINLHPDAIESIRTYLEVRQPKNPNDKALFLNAWGYRIGNTDIHCTIKRYALKLGITNKKVYPHLFRITGITHLAQHGVNIKIIQKQSRHSDIETLMGYIQPTDEEVRDGYLKGMSLDTNDTTKPPTETDEPKPQPQHISKQSNDDDTSRYIAMFKGELIDKEEFFRLVSTDKQPHQSTNYIQ